MTLEDFFTLNELKDGLTTPARVNELLAVMQKEMESAVENVGETSRQWSAVASTIAATVNKECLDLFLQLEGLWFIDRWLSDAQKFENDTGNKFLEELIISLLRAIERLQVDSNKSMASGIGKTMEGILSHGSSVVREKAKNLYDSWKTVHDIDATLKDAEKIEAIGDGRETECPSVDISPSSNNNEENVERTTDKNMVEETDKEDILTQEIITESVTVDSSNTSVSVGGNLTVNFDNDKTKSESNALMGISGSTPTGPDNTCEEQIDASQLDNKHVEVENEKQETNEGVAELTALSGPLEHNTVPPSVDNASESATKTEMMEETSVKDEDMMDGGESPEHHHSTMEFNTTTHTSDSSSESENPKMTSSRESDEGEVAKKDVGVQSEDDSGSRSRFSRSKRGQDGDLISKRPSDMELDYGIVDPLELARQVASEVEREVDSQERSCSSSQNISGSIIDRANRPDSKNKKEYRSAEGSTKEISSSAAEPVNDVETPISKPEIPLTKISKKAPESEPNTEKGFSGFDLNEEVSSEEIDCPVDMVSIPISVASASRAAVAEGLPASPLQFEGTLGWKGSAATSAFRPIPEVEKTFSSSSSPNNSKQRLDCLDFDLNVAESNEDKIEDLFPRDKMPMTSFLPSGEETSAEASPMKLSRVQLDLNSLGDGDSGPIALDWKRNGRITSLRSNGPQSPSVSSSSSSIQPSFRNIDLNWNDHLAIPNNASLDNPFLSKLFKNTKRDESVISIFGTKVEVKRKDSVHSSNGRILDPAVNISLGRPGSSLGLGSSSPYANLPAYSQNSFPMGPAMPFTTYGPPGGPIPYMVDTRGAPFVPQIIGTTSSIPPSFSQSTQPFLFNMAATGTSSGSNGAGPSRHNSDLSSGFLSNGGNQENNGGLRQFFIHNQGRPIDEQYLRMGNSLQASSSSVIGGKRQEPDSGWEPFPINYKYHEPPWQ